MEERNCVSKTFGGARQTKGLDIVELSVKTKVGLVNIQAFVSEISYPLKAQNPRLAQATYPHLQRLRLADYNNSTPIDIDVLIGANFYWNFIDGKTVDSL